MSKSIAIIGTLDTKGDQIEYLKQLIEGKGHQTIVIDVGILREPHFEPTITHQQVAQASGLSLEEIIAFGDSTYAISKMTEGASRIVKDLHSTGKIHGLVAVGGSMGASLALAVMKVLPIGMPKLLLSTLAFSHLIHPDDISGDLMMMQWPAGLWGLNSIVKEVLASAAGAISGAADAHERARPKGKTVVGVTSLGMRACGYLFWLKPALEERGYEVAVFHATGMGGRMFEQAIDAGLIDIALDLSLTELISQFAGGACSAGEHRLEAAGKRGIPQIVAPGNIQVFHWAGWEPIPPKLRNRFRIKHNSLLSVIKSSKEEKVAVAELMAAKLNKARGPVMVVIPSEPPKMPAGPRFGDPKGMEAFRREFKAHIRPEIKVVELDVDLNNQAFADAVLALFDEMMQKQAVA